MLKITFLLILLWTFPPFANGLIDPGIEIPDLDNICQRLTMIKVLILFVLHFNALPASFGAWGSVVVKALRY
jgi:hypothetical protein